MIRMLLIGYAFGAIGRIGAIWTASLCLSNG
jgi:hypothetical protein